MRECILVVDDNPLLLATIGEALQRDGMVPVLASGAEDALRHLRDTMPDALVVDLDMRDGPAVLTQIERATGDVVPVIALSSRPRLLLVDARFADAVLVKPFELAALRGCVQRACTQPAPGW